MLIDTSTVTLTPLRKYRQHVTGTATSSRGRGESNSFNVLRVEGSCIRVQRYSWNEDGADFEKVSTEAFERMGGVWASNRPL